MARKERRRSQFEHEAIRKRGTVGAQHTFHHPMGSPTVHTFDNKTASSINKAQLAKLTKKAGNVFNE